MTDTQQPAPVVQRPTLAIRPAPGRNKIVTMPVDGDVNMGARDEVAAHYKIAPEDMTPHATTLDYLIGATGACLTGTFAGRLAALGQETGDGKLESIAEGVIVNEKAVLRVRSIHVTYTLQRNPDVPVEKIERAHERHHKYCPVAASIGSAVELTSELVLAD